MTAIDYQGAQSSLRLVTGSGRELHAYLPSAAAASLARGGEVWAGWAPEDAVVLTE